MEWTLKEGSEFVRRFKQLRKKHGKACQAVFDNLDTYQTTLNAGVHSQQIQFGFFHKEPCGVRAIDQSGAGANAPQLRLYTLALLKRKQIYLITMGTKKTQSADIKFCEEVAPILKEEDERS